MFDSPIPAVFSSAVFHLPEGRGLLSSSRPGNSIPAGMSDIYYTPQQSALQQTFCKTNSKKFPPV